MGPAKLWQHILLCLIPKMLACTEITCCALPMAIVGFAESIVLHMQPPIVTIIDAKLCRCHIIVCKRAHVVQIEMWSAGGTDVGQQPILKELEKHLHRLTKTPTSPPDACQAGWHRLVAITITSKALSHSL